MQPSSTHIQNIFQTIKDLSSQPSNSITIQQTDSSSNSTQVYPETDLLAHHIEILYRIIQQLSLSSPIKITKSD